MSLCTLRLVACGGDRGIVGAYDTGATEDDNGSSESADTNIDATSETGEACVDDCDPDFAVTRLSMINADATRIHLLATDTCEGERCPADLGEVRYGDELVTSCTETAAALASPLGPQEYCRPAALTAAFAIEVGFATAVDRPSFEWVRTGPEGAAEEPYWWASEAVTIHGPGTRYRATVDATPAGTPEISSAALNFTCIERLEQQGVAWTPATLDAACNTTWDDGGALRPLRMTNDATFSTVRGRLTGLGRDCSGADVDACCDACDHQLSTAIAKYGVDEDGARRNPVTAITCDPEADRYTSCRDFVPSVDRSLDESMHVYAWDGDAQAWPIPLVDKLRETHPDRRPSELEILGVACTDDDACDEGWRCIGSDAQGLACAAGDDCGGGVCRAPWPVACVADLDTTGPTGFCVDLRFDDRGAAACYVAEADFASGSAGDRLSVCDTDDNGLDADEGCDPALGGEAICDPLMQPGVAPIPRYDRDPQLAATWQCACDDESAALPECAEAVATWCAAPLGEGGVGPLASPAGAFAIQNVERKGGMQWNAELAHVEVRIADFGTTKHANAESCAASRFRIPSPSAAESRRNGVLGERDTDDDVALCSGSTYRLEFTDGSAPEHVRSEAGGTLEGRSVHVFETSQFRIIAGSAFPTDDLTIGACDDLGVRFSNKFDLSPTNLRKLMLFASGSLVAGGVDCDADATPEEIAGGAIPCLTVDISEEITGGIAVSIDAEIHGPVLQVGERYDLIVPGLGTIDQMSDPSLYAAAFHDACGMPLVHGGTDEATEVSFVIDAPCE